ncbi:hypothetical protein RAA17_16780 [Komagataeibacter rhaeticus]|nr:hypothetical protein [Komagataeibacter rhaeticus]
MCLKQALPHVRVDPTWKMPLDRTFFESEWLRAVQPLAPGLTTEFLHYDPELYVLIVESLSGHTVLRTALMQGHGGRTWRRVSARSWPMPHSAPRFWPVRSRMCSPPAACFPPIWP